MIWAYLLSASSYLAGVGLNVTSGWLITMASFMPPVLTLNVAVVMVRFFGIARSVTRYGERVISHKSVFKKLAFLRSDIYDRITSNPLQLLRENRTGSLVKQVVDDVERAQEYELRVALPGITAKITLFAAFGLAFWLQSKISYIWFGVFLALGFFVPFFSNKILKKSARQIEVLEANYADRIRINTHGHLEAENYGYLDQYVTETNELESKIELAERKHLNQIRNFQLGINLIISLSLLLTILMVRLPAVQVAMLIFLALTGFEAVLAWYPNLFASGKLLLAKSKLNEIPRSPIPIKHTVHFDKLIAQNFKPYWNKFNPNSIQPISFELKRGDVLVLRGPSGVGKTTTAMGILGFLDYEGSLSINGVEVRDIENLSDLIVGSLQNGHIFNTTISENLKISNQNLQNIFDVLELNELLASTDNGINTVIGQFGRGLSGGEIKRLNLARALINDAPILILDEPLEHLNPELAERIERRILEKYRDRILIIITHTGFRGLPELNLGQLIEN